MSRHSMEKITCPECGKTSDFIVWDSINTMLDPEMKAKVRTGEAFLFKCPHCGYSSNVDYQTLYHQMEDHVMIYYVPADTAKTIQTLQALRVNGAKTGLALDPDYRVRVVKTMNQFREKLNILDADLNDKIIELAKVIIFVSVRESQPDLKIEDFLFNVQQDGQWFFSVHLGNGAWGSVDLSKELYSSIEKDFAEFLTDTDDDMVIDGTWALRIFAKKGETLE